MTTSCVFSSAPDPPLLYYQEGVGTCSGDCTSLKDVQSMKYPLYGAIDCLDLLLLRGGQVVRWDNDNERIDMESKHVCEGHLSSLLIAWERNKFCFVYGRNNYKKNSFACGLHKINHKKSRPITTRRLSKDDAINYMTKMGVLCHVGTPICTQHLNAIRLKKHDAIGEGMIVPKEQLPHTTFKWTIHKEGGYLSQSDHFWKEIGSTREIVKEDQQESKEELTENTEFRRCPDMLCLSRFKTNTGLQSHITRGKHSYYKDHESMTDFALKSFSDMVESTEEAQIAVQEDSIVPLCVKYDSEESKKGWALRKTERPGLLDPDVKKEVERLVSEQLDNGRRAEAREIRDQLRNMIHADGSYRFTIKKCLSEGQIKSQITRILNQRKKVDEEKSDSDPLIAQQANTQSPKKRGRKRKEIPQDDTQKPKKRGRPRKNSLDEQKEENVKEIEEIEETEEEEEEEIEEEEINCLELMESEIQKMIDDIFDTD